MKHDETYEDTWEAKENGWLPYVKNHVSSTGFCYARYILGMEKLTIFSMKNSLTLPSSANKYFKILGEENEEPIYTYTDPFMRNFVRKTVKGCRCNAFIQHYQSENSDEVFVVLFQKKLNVNGNICHLLEKNFEILNN